MSFWGDFAGGFLEDQSRQMRQAEQLSIAEAIEARRRQRQIEDEERARVARKEDQVDLLNAQSEPTVGYGASGEAALLRRKFSLDNGRIQRTDEELGKPLMRPRGKPYEVKENGQIVTYQEYSDGLTSEQRQIATAPRMQPGGPGVPRNAAGLTPWEQARLDRDKRRDAERAEREAAKELDLKVQADLEAARSTLNKLKPEDFRPDRTGYIKAGDILQSELGLDRNIRTKADALKAVEQAARERHAPAPPPDLLAEARQIIEADPKLRDEVIRRLRSKNYSTRDL